MIPLGDSVGRRPAAGRHARADRGCVVVFLYELTLRGAALDQFVERWGAVPRLIVPALLGDPRVPRVTLLTLLTSQFVHAGFLHLGGNMLFLWVFGRAVEDRLGSPLYLAFYLRPGAVAGLVQCLVSPTDAEPLIGASGAIAGVLGLVLHHVPDRLDTRAGARPVLLLDVRSARRAGAGVLVCQPVLQRHRGHHPRQSRHITRRRRLGARGGLRVRRDRRPGAVSHLATKPENRSSRAAARRDNAPGPARLVASVADLAALLLAARLVVSFFGLVAARSPVAPFAAPIVAVTQPVLSPLQSFLPTLRVMGGVLETYTLVAMVAVYVLAAWSARPSCGSEVGYGYGVLIRGQRRSASAHAGLRRADVARATWSTSSSAHTDLDVIAITDHDETSASLEAREWAARHGYRVQVVPGVEVTTREGHLLALFIEERPPALRALQATAEWVLAQGGLCVAPHPFTPLDALAERRARWPGRRARPAGGRRSAERQSGRPRVAAARAGASSQRHGLARWARRTRTWWRWSAWRGRAFPAARPHDLRRAHRDGRDVGRGSLRHARRDGGRGDPAAGALDGPAAAAAHRALRARRGASAIARREVASES